MEDGFWREFYASYLPARTNNADVAPARDLSRENFNRNNLVYNSMGQSQSQRQSQSQMYVTRTSTSNGGQPLPAQTPARVSDVDRQQILRHLSQLEASRMNSQLFSSQAAPQQQMSSGRHTSSPIPPDRFRSHQPQPMNQRTPVPVRPSAPSPRPHGSVGPATSQNHYSLADIHRATQVMTRSPSTPSPILTSGSPTPTTSSPDQRGTTDSVDATVDPNWRPTGRMRGSLSGRAYSEALSQYVIHPNQPVQAARPPVLNTPRPFIPPHLQALMANNLRTQTPQAGSGPDSDAVAGGVLPDK